MARATLLAVLACGLAVAASARAGAQTTPPPTAPLVPKPFPGSTPPPASPPAKTPPAPSTTAASPTPPPAQTAPPAGQPPAPPAATAAAPGGAPSETTLGVKIFPGAEFLEAHDAGLGQRLYLYGTNAAFLDVVAFYKGELRTNGRELFKTPAMQEFDLDKFVEDKMAYPPSVVVKDYTWTGLSGDLKDGYLFLDGTTEKRFKTVLQIVPGPVK